MATPPLRCWWDGEHVADFTPARGRGWELRCRYTASAVEKWATGLPLLSCSLPVQTRPLPASNFLRGLLPEGVHLQSLATMAGVATNDTYRLLARYGRDVAGALVITAGDEPPSSEDWRVESYDDDALDQEIIGLADGGLGVRVDSELSIAGLQNKLLLVARPGRRWGRPVHGYPSTHILKTDDERHPGLVNAEAACLSLAHAVGLAPSQPITATIGGRDCIIVERFDRQVVKGNVVRVHQEDTCQALNVNTDADRGRGKYETSGGPTLAQIGTLLRTYAQDQQRELEQLMRLTVFTIVTGNADSHGKNISFLHDRDGYVSLAPAYDTVPTMLWPNLRLSAAMSVNGTRDFNRMTLKSIVAEAQRWGLPPEIAHATALSFTEILLASAALLPDGGLQTAITQRAERLITNAE